MALSDHLPDATSGGPRCRVGLALEALDRDDRNTLLLWLVDREVSARRIAAAVRSATDVPLGAGSVGAHRRKECRCP